MTHKKTALITASLFFILWLGILYAGADHPPVSHIPTEPATFLTEVPLQERAPFISCYNRFMEYDQFFSSDHIKQFCQRNHIRRLLCFGSIVREDFSPNSDIDVLVEFEAGHTPGFDFFFMEAELSRLLGRKVDLQTLKFISREFHSSVLSEAVPVYEQTRS